MHHSLLQIKNISLNFGGIQAVRSVSLEFLENSVHAIIGPNGAGKTTLINILSGEFPPSNGKIFFKTHEITGTPPHNISQLGIGRSYQQVKIINDMTCYENCCLGAGNKIRGFGFFRSKENNKNISEQVRNALDYVGLSDRAEVLAGELSYGEQRQLEISIILVAQPAILLLDEPLAGMGAADSKAMIKLIKRVSEQCLVILVEHDMDAVFQLANTLTVMVEGRVIASGTPESIRINRQVQDTYLGGATF